MTTKEVVIRLARESGFVLFDSATDEAITRFKRLVDLVRAEENEACAVECERMKMYPGGRQEAPAHHDVWCAAKAIRARMNHAAPSA